MTAPPIIGISCSPRRGGNTDILVEAVLQAAAQTGAVVEFVRAADLAISACDGCWRCSQKGECHIRDDMQGLYPRLLRADGIVIGSPVQMGHSVSGQAQVLLDRTFAFWHHKKLKGKVGGSVSVSNRRGGVSAVRVIDDVLLDQQMLPAGYATGFGRAPGDIRRDARALKEADALGKRICELIASTRS